MAGLLLLAPAASAGDPARSIEEVKLGTLFHNIEALEPIQAGALTVVPLRARTLTDPIRVKGHPTFLEATLVDATPARPVLRLENPKDRPVLVAAGRVAHTGTADLILAHDVVVPAKGTSLARALPGSFERGATAPGDTLTWYPRWAPPSLREAIVSDATSYDVKTFLSLFHEVVAHEGAGLPTLREVISSSFAKYLDAEVAQIMHKPAFRADDVIGFVSGIYGRPVALQLFGSPELHRKQASKLLESHGIYAAAMTARAEALGIPIHTGAKAKAMLAETTRDLLATLRFKSRIEGQIDGIHAIRGPGVVGNSVWYSDRPVHIVIYPHDPYEKVLFSRIFEAPAPKPEPAEAKPTPAAAGGS
ncbi:MAG: hypothetical protein QNJ98_04845 [Planctomycetota bacterium]|nr:hypothetical protein [Planctomycetota bacterium]